MKFNKDNYRYVDHTPKGSDTREVIAITSYLGSVVRDQLNVILEILLIQTSVKLLQHFVAIKKLLKRE